MKIKVPVATEGHSTAKPGGMPITTNDSMTFQSTIFRLTAAIAGAQNRIAEQRRRLTRVRAEAEAAESQSALELMELQLDRLERHCLAVSGREARPMQ